MCVGSFLVINIYNIWYTCIQAVCRERERENDINVAFTSG